MNKRPMILIIFKTLLMTLCVFSACYTIAKEKSDAFVITYYDKRVKVVSPDDFSNKLNVIVENQSLSKLWGKVQRTNGDVVSYVAIPPEGFQAVEVSLKKGELVRFVPLSPASQELLLKVGSKVYEIPPQD